MGYHAYEGVPDEILDQQRTTSSNERYTLRCSDSLRVEMPFVGRDNSKANSQGWLRDSGYYFKALHQSHPEMFSKKNTARIQQGEAPVVDQKMIDHNPQWKDFRGQPLIHHHVGGDGEVAAVPKGAHKGSGEIHNHEKAAGITGQCRQFSDQCENHTHSNPKDLGLTSSQLRPAVAGSQGQTGAPNQGSGETAGTQSSTQASAQSGTQTATQGERSSTVRNATGSGTAASASADKRADTVRSHVRDAESGSAHAAHERSNTVRTATESSGNKKSSGGQSGSESKGASAGSQSGGQSK